VFNRVRVDVSVFLNGNKAADLGIATVPGAQLYRLNGEEFRQRSVKPDIVLPSTSDQPAGDGPDSTAKPKLRPARAVEIHVQNMVDPDMIRALEAASVDRRRASPGFQRLRAALEDARRHGTRVVEPLNEQEYRAAHAADPAGGTPTKPGAADLIRTEAVAVAADYVRAVGVRTATPGKPALESADDPSFRIESARRAVQMLENEFALANATITAAVMKVEARQKDLGAAEPGSAREVLAEIAHTAALRECAELKRARDRLDLELKAARERSDRLPARK
jgi:hypothetical protein